MPASNSRFTHKSEQCSTAWLGWPCSWGCGFVMQHVQWQCWFQLFSLSSVPITELTFLGKIFFFFNQISPLIQFKMQYCKQLCCHNQMGWRWAVRREEMESGSQWKYLILSLQWVYICFLFLMPAVFCFLLLRWVKAWSEEMVSSGFHGYPLLVLCTFLLRPHCCFIPRSFTVLGKWHLGFLFPRKDRSEGRMCFHSKYQLHLPL